MFIENKYTSLYYKLINQHGFNIRPANGYYEKHHIVPISLGGTRKKSNEIYVSARVHFLCHALLLRMVSTPKAKRSMSFAFFTMKRSNGSARYDHINSKLYEVYRVRAAKNTSGSNNPFYKKGDMIKGSKNPMWGKPCYYRMTEEEKKRWKSNISKGNLGEKNSFYGKNHSDETKELISKSRRHNIEVVFVSGEVYRFNQPALLGEHLGKSRHLGAKLYKPECQHLHEKYGIESIRRVYDE